jgi:hypothetical protein
MSFKVRDIGIHLPFLLKICEKLKAYPRVSLFRIESQEDPPTFEEKPALVNDQATICVPDPTLLGPYKSTIDETKVTIPIRPTNINQSLAIVTQSERNYPKKSTEAPRGNAHPQTKADSKSPKRSGKNVANVQRHSEVKTSEIQMVQSF